jgi:hypothetical protein
MDDWYDEFDLSVEDVAFLLGVFAARGITSPSEGEFESALDLLYCHFATLEAEQFADRTTTLRHGPFKLQGQ